MLQLASLALCCLLWLGVPVSAARANPLGGRPPATLSPNMLLNEEAAPQQALLLSDASSPAALFALAARVRQMGGLPLATFPNQAMLISLDNANFAQRAQSIASLPGVRLISVDLVPPAQAGPDGGAQQAVQVWNQMVNQQRSRPGQTTLTVPDGAHAALPAMPANDAIPLARPNQLSGAAQHAPLFWQTSEFMLRSVNVDVFLPESNGVVDPDSETWTKSMRDAVQTEVTSGLTWWALAAKQGGRPGGDLVFNVQFHTPFNEPALVATGYEPITHPYTDEDMWVNQVMNRLGYHDSSHLNNLLHYNDDRRIALGCDWSVSIFVVNSKNDTDGAFSDDRFAYAYIQGPLMVVTYDNGGWGIDNMEMIVAHEHAHLFGALDEYAASNCADSDVSGYLAIANTNCENGDPPSEHSIMRSAGDQFYAYPNYLVSTPARAMVGWRDQDSDGLYDPLDTVPILAIAPLDFTYTKDSAVTWTGMVYDVPFPSPWHSPLSINPLQAVEMRLNGGPWQACTAQDGAFDETDEDFICTASGLSEGMHQMEVRARNRANQWSLPPYPETSLGVDTIPPQLTVDAPLLVSGSLLLHWSAVDDGIGAVQYDVQLRLNESSPWIDWLTAVGQTSTTISQQSFDLNGTGATYEQIGARVRARDGLGNTSAYLEASPHQTRFMLYLPVAAR